MCSRRAQMYTNANSYNVTILLVRFRVSFPKGFHFTDDRQTPVFTLMFLNNTPKRFTHLDVRLKILPTLRRGAQLLGTQASNYIRSRSLSGLFHINQFGGGYFA
jgi:hypothetical protein